LGRILLDIRMILKRFDGILEKIAIFKSEMRVAAETRLNFSFRKVGYVNRQRLKSEPLNSEP